MKNEIILDAENAVMGRLASFSAKQALLGKNVIIVNSEKAIIIGNKANIVEHYLWKKGMGGSNLSGPFIHAVPEKIIKRTIRGMLPYKQERGLLAFKRIKSFSGIPKEYENVKMIKSIRGKKGITLAELVRIMRRK